MINIDHLHTNTNKSDSRVDEAVTVGIRHIGIAVYSSGKVYEYLVRKGFESDIAHTAVKELIERKYLDDIRAGRKVINSRTGRRQESKALLYKRLIAAGVAEDKADELITMTRDDKETCLSLIESAYPVIPDELLYEGDSSLYDDIMKLCMRRGYTPNLARNSINQWINDNK